MNSSAVYIEIDVQGKVSYYARELENHADLNYIERYLPVLARPGEAIEDRLHSLLVADFELLDYLEDGEEWGVLLDRGRRVLLLYGFGGGWELPDKALARLVLPLLQGQGWKAWRLEHAPRGAWQFAQYLEPWQAEPAPESLSCYSAPDHFEAYPALPLHSSHENLLVSLRSESRWRHYLCVSDEGYFKLGELLARGPGVLTELEIFFESELPDETAFLCTLLIDAERRYLAYSFERTFMDHRAYDAREVSRRWPGWEFKLLPDAASHLRQVTGPEQAAWLQLNPCRLQAWMRDLETELKSPADIRVQGRSYPLTKLMLSDWFELLLPHPEQGPALIQELHELVPELASERPAVWIDPNPARCPTAFDYDKSIRPRPASFIAEIPRELLLLYDCLFGHPPWLAQALNWPLKVPPSDAELTIEFELLACDPELCWQWLWRCEAFLQHAAKDEHGEWLTQWPRYMPHPERAVKMSLILLKACLHHLHSERELICLMRILDLSPRLAVFFQDATLPLIDSHPARQLSHQLLLRDFLFRHRLSESERRQVLIPIEQPNDTIMLIWNPERVYEPQYSYRDQGNRRGAQTVAQAAA